MAAQVWTPELILDGIQRLARKGGPLSHGSVVGANPRLLYAAERLFGSWSAALAAAGVNLAEVRSESKARRAEKITKWSPESIVDQIKKLASSGERVTGLAVRLRYPSLYYAAVSDRYFGGWSAALAAAGLERDRTRTRADSLDAWQSTLLLDRILELKRKFGDLSGDLARTVCPEIVEAAERRFGDWGSAMQLAGSADRKTP